MKNMLKYPVYIICAWLIIELSYKIYVAGIYLNNSNFDYEHYVLDRNAHTLDTLIREIKESNLTHYYYDTGFPDTRNLDVLPAAIRQEVEVLRFDITNNKCNFFLNVNKSPGNYTITISGGDYFIEEPYSLDFTLVATNDKEEIKKALSSNYFHYKDDIYVQRCKRSPLLILLYNDMRYNFSISNIYYAFVLAGKRDKFAVQYFCDLVK